MLLQEMGCALIPRNEHGRRAFGGDSSPTAANGHAHTTASRPAEAMSAGAGGCALVYLAHCKPELCNALLDANWTPAQLASFAIIGRGPGALLGACVKCGAEPQYYGASTPCLEGYLDEMYRGLVMQATACTLARRRGR